MKHRLVNMIFLLVGISVSAQDLQRISERDIAGTARYVGMAGAMTAIGGDPSAVKDNPAGLGVYRRMELAISFDDQLDMTRQFGVNSMRDRNRFNASQASWVISFLNSQRTQGVIAHNIMLSYNRLKSFNRQYYGVAQNVPQSLAQVIADKTNGLYPSDLQPAERWNDSEIGWLSCAGYDTYLINPKWEDMSQWEPTPNAKNVNNALDYSEVGEVNQYSATWAMNISNRLYIGVGLNIQSLYYNASSRYVETFGRMGRYEQLQDNSTVTLTGTAFNTTVGVLYRPIQMVRLGASFQTPSAVRLGMRSDGFLSGTIDSTLTSQAPFIYSTSRLGYVMPLRSSVGMALQFWNYGMLSFQYDYTHWAKDQQKDVARRNTMSDVHSLRVGAEGVIINRVFIDAGYAYEASFLKEDPICQMEYNSVRFDTYFRHYCSTQYVSAGLGYRGAWFLVHLAYQYRWQNVNLYAHELALPYDMRTNTHRIVLTINWHMAD